MQDLYMQDFVTALGDFSCKCHPCQLKLLCWLTIRVIATECCKKAKTCSTECKYQDSYIFLIMAHISSILSCWVMFFHIKLARIVANYRYTQTNLFLNCTCMGNNSWSLINFGDVRSRYYLQKSVFTANHMHILHLSDSLLFNFLMWSSLQILTLPFFPWWWLVKMSAKAFVI